MRGRAPGVAGVCERLHHQGGGLGAAQRAGGQRLLDARRDQVPRHRRRRLRRRHPGRPRHSPAPFTLTSLLPRLRLACHGTGAS
jgi:hypothetical protein